MESSAVTLNTMVALLKEIGDRGIGGAWVSAWQAVASDGWCSVEDQIRSSFPHDPELADRVAARYADVASSMVNETRSLNPR